MYSTRPNVIARQLIGAVGAALILVAVAAIPLALSEGHVGWALVFLVPGIVGAWFIRFARNTSEDALEEKRSQLFDEKV